ncbi:MAG: phosphatidate cytidylyltransferase [Planctomycetes bacterium]|nr:phosphatidate cytidylyltransferase [Planctomycetota bacterium]
MTGDRKVMTRVIGAPLLLAALAGIGYLDWRVLERPLGVIALLALFAVGSYHELCAMARRRGLRPAEGLGWVALVLAFAGVFHGFWKGSAVAADLLILIPTYLILVLALLVVRHEEFSPADAGVSVLGVFYVALLVFVVLPLQQMRFPHGMLYLVFLVATNKGSDMAAYVGGKLLGRRKLAPVISPNKTWEGAVAGFVAGAGAGVLVVQGTLLHMEMGAPPLWVVWIYAAAVTAAAQMGDLVKSAIKRWAGVKDSGRLLPEFGGALDMCDSFILSAPVAWLGLKDFLDAP